MSDRDWAFEMWLAMMMDDAAEVREDVLEPTA